MSKAVILLHGFLNNSLVMFYLGSKIKAAGFKVYHFDYKTRHYSDTTLEDLNNLVLSVKEEEIYLVGHSMGGLVIRNYIHNSKYTHNLSRLKSVVTVATPHNQSMTAHTINQKIKGFLGTAGEAGLTKELGEWNSKIPLGCIAGIYNSKLNTNLFLMLNGDKSQSDGTVYLKEAILKNNKDNVTVKGSHTGLLFKKEVAQQIICFLNKLEFNK